MARRNFGSRRARIDSSYKSQFGSDARCRVAESIDQVRNGMRERATYVPAWPLPEELIAREITPEMAEVSEAVKKTPWLKTSNNIRQDDDVYADWDGATVNVMTRSPIPAHVWPFGYQVYNQSMSATHSRELLGKALAKQISTVIMLYQQAALTATLAKHILQTSHGVMQFANTWPRLARVIVDKRFTAEPELKDYFLRPAPAERIDVSWQAAMAQCDDWIAQWIAMSMAGKANERPMRVAINKWGEQSDEVKKYIAQLETIPVWV